MSFEYRLNEFLRVVTSFAEGAELSGRVPREDRAALDFIFVIPAAAVRGGKCEENDTGSRFPQDLGYRKTTPGVVFPFRLFRHGLLAGPRSIIEVSP